MSIGKCIVHRFYFCIHIFSVESARLGLSMDGILHCNTMTLCWTVFFLCHTLNIATGPHLHCNRSEIVFDDSINYDPHRNCIILLILWLLFYTACSSVQACWRQFSPERDRYEVERKKWMYEFIRCYFEITAPCDGYWQD